MEEKDISAYVKRLQTVQNMTDTLGTKELCEILMDLLEDTKNGNTPFGFQAKEKK